MKCDVNFHLIIGSMIRLTGLLCCLILASPNAQAKPDIEASDQTASTITQLAATSANSNAKKPFAERDPVWTHRHEEGWFWRDLDPLKKKAREKAAREKKAATQTAKPTPNQLYPDMNKALKDPLKVLKALQKAVEVSKARAVLQPTPKNVLAFMKVQNELLKKNTLFADNWQRVVWQNPQYDYTQVRPAYPEALATYSQAYRNDRRKAMRRIAKEYGLYFVISGGCPYCHAMAPYLKRFADRYGFTVITVTMDGGTVPEFPNAKYSPEFAEKMGVKITPAIILAKPDQGIVKPISYGFVSLQELELRIYRLFEQKPGHMNYRLSSVKQMP